MKGKIPFTIIAKYPGGRYFYHYDFKADGTCISCRAPWEIDPAGFIFTKCSHCVILTDEKVRWN